MIEPKVTQLVHGTAGNYNLAKAMLCLSPAFTLHTAGPVQVNGDLEARQRCGGLVWERGPGFLAPSLGLQPQDHTAPCQ